MVNNVYQRYQNHMRSAILHIAMYDTLTKVASSLLFYDTKRNGACLILIIQATVYVVVSVFCMWYASWGVWPDLPGQMDPGRVPFGTIQ